RLRSRARWPHSSARRARAWPRLGRARPRGGSALLLRAALREPARTPIHRRAAPDFGRPEAGAADSQFASMASCTLLGPTEPTDPRTTVRGRPELGRGFRPRSQSVGGQEAAIFADRKRVVDALYVFGRELDI